MDHIYSLKNKLHLLNEIVRDKIDVLIISKRKLDFSFHEAQFYMESFSQPSRLDRTDKGGGITLDAKEEISPRLIQPACRKPKAE